MSDDQSEGLPTAAEVHRQYPNGDVTFYSIVGGLVDEGDELVRRSDVEALFKPQQNARTLEDLSRRLQAAATNPFDKEEVLTVAKELSDLADEHAELFDEVQGQ